MKLKTIIPGTGFSAWCIKDKDDVNGTQVPLVAWGLDEEGRVWPIALNHGTASIVDPVWGREWIAVLPNGERPPLDDIAKIREHRYGRK